MPLLLPILLGIPLIIGGGWVVYKIIGPPYSAPPAMSVLTPPASKSAYGDCFISRSRKRIEFVCPESENLAERAKELLKDTPDAKIIGHIIETK